MTPVGFEPTQLALVELESTPLDHSGKVSMRAIPQRPCDKSCAYFLRLVRQATNLAALGLSYKEIIPRGRGQRVRPIFNLGA